MWILLEALFALFLLGLNKHQHCWHLLCVCLCRPLCKAVLFRMWPAGQSIQIATSVKEEICAKIKVPRNFCSREPSLDYVHICLYLYIIKGKIYVEKKREHAFIHKCVYIYDFKIPASFKSLFHNCLWTLKSSKTSPGLVWGSIIKAP